MNALQSTQPAQPQLRRAGPPARRTAEEPAPVLMNLLPPLIGAIVGIGILLAVGAALVNQAGGLAALGAALVGSQSAWYLSRASAFVAYLLLWWSMMLGLAMTNRLARIWPGGPTAGALHEHASVLGLVFVAVHAFTLLADQYIGYTLPQILVPFASTYLPLWVGLGQIALYLMLLVTASSYVRRWIGPRAWRIIHFASFAVFVLALGHGMFSGTDSGTLWALLMYVGTGLSVLAMTIYRIFAPRPAKRAQNPPAAA